MTVIAIGSRRTGPARLFDDPISDDVAGKPLTAREHQVLCLVVRGLPNRGIARMLGISESTVKNHLRAVFGKLNVTDRTQAALLAVRTGLSA
jgi:DNA-binding NarL/FixJ family response regulator